MATNIKRRNFLKTSLLAGSGIILVPNFISCKDDPTYLGKIPETLESKNFNEGVASFDPTNSQVIIWTRYTTTNPSADIVWQLAEDAEFKKIVRQSEVTTDASRDYTVAVEIKGLDQNKKFYYRFIHVNDKVVSPVGETLTFGVNTTDVKLAVASCANYAYGYFNVYDAISKSDADVVIHLGDYIYEYGKDTYGSFRVPNPEGETISLEDYRMRYRQYRSDERLLKLHQKKPFICVWDDHEIANDCYKEGAENHQTNEGDYQDRKKMALQAYSEYLPNTTNITDHSIIYRNLKIGNLVDLIMLDTRVVGRDKQLNYADYYDANGQFDAAAFQSAWLDPNRTLLGETQRIWLVEQMNKVNSSWQIIGQQVLMAKMLMPAELLPILAKILAEVAATGSASAPTFQFFQQTITELVTIKSRLLQGDPSLTPQEIARVKTVLPYNLDAWDGYFVERELVLSTFKDKKVVVLAGDTHNAWQSNLTDSNGNKMAVELATSSVSSPGLEVYLGTNPTQLEEALKLLIDDLNYLNASQRGFVKVTVTVGSVNAEWNFVDTVTDQTYNSAVGHTYSI